MKGEIKMQEYYPEGYLIKRDANMRYLSSIDTLREAQFEGVILEANAILCDGSHDLTVDLGCMKGIIKREDGAIGIAEGTTRDIALISRVGKPVCFRVLDIKNTDTGEPYAILSRKLAQRECLEFILNSKVCGDIINAKVTHLESFGAFCDIGCGNIALLPIDSISVSRISHPKDRFSVGDNIKAIIKAFGEDGRITLSHKELLGTWEENAAFFLPGQTVSGIVRSTESYGIFVELAPNLAGLAEVGPKVSVGQSVSVYIKSIIPEKMKIKLIIIDELDYTPPKKIKYFYEKEHIDSFTYSPQTSAKLIITDFQNSN